MDNASIRVGHLVNQFGHGVIAGDLTKALNEYTDLESTVISLQKPEDFPEQIPVDFPSHIASPSRLSASRIRWLYQTIRKFDIITAHQTFAGLIGSLLAKTQGKTVLAREGNNHEKFSRKVRLARTITGISSEHIVCVSQSVANSYKGFERVIPRSKFTVITNGVDVHAVQSARTIEWSIYSSAQIDPGASVIGTVGMLVEQKNHETLLRAMARLANKDSMNVELVIAGSGPLCTDLQALSRELGIENRVHFLGYLKRKKVYKMLHEIDCYAMPSRWEGHSAAVLQAMAAGVPCVLSDIPSFRSQYQEEVVIFHQPESPQELAHSIGSVLRNETEKGQRGKEYVTENYSIEQMALKYEKVIQEIL